MPAAMWQDATSLRPTVLESWTTSILLPWEQHTGVQAGKAPWIQGHKQPWALGPVEGSCITTAAEIWECAGKREKAAAGKWKPGEGERDRETETQRETETLEMERWTPICVEALGAEKDG